jgi:mono/diheme cytochrome c family protein
MREPIAPAAIPSIEQERVLSGLPPPFRTLHLRYPVETLGEALAEGIYTGHADMPAFQLDPDQIHDLLSYLKTLE